MKKILGIMLITMFLGTTVSCSSLDTSTKKGTAYGAGGGAAAGALLGQAIGGDTSATLWGAAIGALIGGVAGHQIGSYMDAQETQLNNVAAKSPRKTVSVKRKEDVLIASFKSDEIFEKGSANLKPAAKAEIDQIADVLNQYSETLIKVEGHTGATGEETDNRRLSKSQANTVKQALVERKVEAKRIVTLGFGEAKPVSSVDRDPTLLIGDSL